MFGLTYLQRAVAKSYFVEWHISKHFLPNLGCGIFDCRIICFRFSNFRIFFAELFCHMVASRNVFCCRMLFGGMNFLRNIVTEWPTLERHQLRTVFGEHWIVRPLPDRRLGMTLWKVAAVKTFLIIVFLEWCFYCDCLNQILYRPVCGLLVGVRFDWMVRPLSEVFNYCFSDVMLLL